MFRLEPIYDRELKLYGYEVLCKKPKNLSEDFFLFKQAVEYISSIKEDGLRYHINLFPKTIELYKEINLNGNRDSIVIEIIEDIADIKELNRLIEKYNIPVAIDDFGTGFANIDFVMSISNLQMVKYERVWWKNFGNSTAETIQYLKNRGIATLAEKIETCEEFKKAKELGFDYFQGYFFKEGCKDGFYNLHTV